MWREEVHVREKRAAGSEGRGATAEAYHKSGDGCTDTARETGKRVDCNRTLYAKINSWSDTFSFASFKENARRLPPFKDKVGSDTSQSDGKPEEKTLESVKITAPGTYELNLPSLFERDELIMAVKEGTYFIDLTSVFKKSKKD